MAVKSSNAIKPITHVYVGVTIPAAGARLDLTNGAPADGREIGALDGPITWDPSWEMTEFDSETHSSPLEYSADGHALTMKVPMKEMLADNLKLALNGDVTEITETGKEGTLVTFGGKTELTGTSVVAIWETKAGSGEFGYAIIYNGVVDGGTSVGFSKSDYTVVEVSIKALPITDRASGDQLGHIFIPNTITAG